MVRSSVLKACKSYCPWSQNRSPDNSQLQSVEKVKKADLKMEHYWEFFFVEFCLFICLRLSAWLEGEEDPVIARVNQRIEDLTGLTVETAELLQVM